LGEKQGLVWAIFNTLTAKFAFIPQNFVLCEKQMSRLLASLTPTAKGAFILIKPQCLLAALRFGVVTPAATKRTACKKNCCSYPGAIMD
jgi:hypothetical protein